MIKTPKLKEFEDIFHLPWILNKLNQNLHIKKKIQVKIWIDNDYDRINLQFIKYFPKLKTFKCKVETYTDCKDLKVGDIILVKLNQICELR